LNYFESNLALLSCRQPELALQLSNAQSAKVKLFSSASGIPTASYEKGSASLSLHSRYDPIKEARQIVKKSDIAGADYFVLIGFGLGYVLDALVESEAGASSRYFIVESDLEILKAALEARDLSPLIKLPHIHFAWPPSGSELAEQWRRFFDPVQAQKNVFITSPSCAALNPELFRSAAELIQSQTFQIFTDINTLVGKSETFLNNFATNFAKAAEAPGISKFSGLFSNIPAVIVSAGPSLDKNIHELRGYQENTLIISTDTALKALLASGISPHFVMTGDPSYENFLHLKDALIKDALVVAEATSHPLVFETFHEKILTCTFENSSLRSLSDILGNKGSLSAWGSVATMALDFALLLKCNPIIFIGQDLAHQDGRIYCSNIYFDDAYFGDISNPLDWQNKIQQLRSARKTVMVEDIRGNPVESTDKLTAYWNWIVKVIEKNPQVRFINATEGGILKEHVKIASLKEALYRECSLNLGLGNRIKRIFDEAQIVNSAKSGCNLSLLRDESAAIGNILKNGLDLCKSETICSVQQLLNKLEKIKDSIYSAVHMAPLVDCLNQMGNVQFLRKRNALIRLPQTSRLSAEYSSIYSEYFNSVRDALSKADAALLRISSNYEHSASHAWDEQSQGMPETSIQASSN
jgi:hypothetical protein